MKKLKIVSVTENNLNIDIFENKMVAKTAKMYATTQTELEELYKCGLSVYKECELKMSPQKFEKDITLWVRQAILIKKS